MFCTSKGSRQRGLIASRGEGGDESFFYFHGKTRVGRTAPKYCGKSRRGNHTKRGREAVESERRRRRKIEMAMKKPKRRGNIFFSAKSRCVRRRGERNKETILFFCRAAPWGWQGTHFPLSRWRANYPWDWDSKRGKMKENYFSTGNEEWYRVGNRVMSLSFRDPTTSDIADFSSSPYLSSSTKLFAAFFIARLNWRILECSSNK